MASPMAVAVMTKKALELAEDKRVRTLLASIVAGIVIVMLIPLLVMVSIFNTQAHKQDSVRRLQESYSMEDLFQRILMRNFPKLWKK